MPVRRVAQPLWLLVSAAWPGGAAVAMEAQSRRAAGVGRGRAGPAARAVGEPGGCAQDPRRSSRSWERPVAGPASFIAAASRRACAP